MPRFRLRSDHEPIHLYQPAGGSDSLAVEPGMVVDAPGSLVTSRPEPKRDEAPPEPLPADAYIVSVGGDERAWPKSTWELVEDKPAVPAVKEK